MRKDQDKHEVEGAKERGNEGGREGQVASSSTLPPCHVGGAGAHDPRIDRVHGGWLSKVWKGGGECSRGTFEANEGGSDSRSVDEGVGVQKASTS